MIEPVLLSVRSLPERPRGKLRAGVALTTFLVVAAFLVAFGLSVIVRAYA
jgi:hypothetical protein